MLSKLSKKKFEDIKDLRKGKVSTKDLQLVSTSIRKYTVGYQNKKGERAPLGDIVKGYQKNQSLWKEILSLDLSQLLRKVQIPYIILQGDTDIVASTERVSEL